MINVLEQDREGVLATDRSSFLGLGFFSIGIFGDSFLGLLFSSRSDNKKIVSFKAMDI